METAVSLDSFRGVPPVLPPRPGAAGQARPRYAFSFLALGERERIVEHLASGGPVAAMVFELANFSLFASLYGDEIAHVVDTLMAQELRALTREYMDGGRSYVETIDPGKYLVLFPLCRKSADTLPDTTLAIRLKLKSRVKLETLNHTGQVLDVLAGHALLDGRGRGTLEDAVYGALCDAQRVAKGELDPAKLALMREFREIVAAPLLNMVYQPIMDFESGRIMAWEALARGPADSSFASPAVLFDFAEEVGSIFALERTCREIAVRRCGPIAPEQKLFLNIHPRTLVDPGFSPGETLGLLARHGLKPSNIVFEITERHRVRDFTLFHRTLEHYRNQGFLVAVDDVGTGYSGLWSIAEIRPDFLKVDMSLVRDIDKNPVKRALFETFVAFSQKIGCSLIAEGIETEQELTCLASLGVHYGQGFHIARPAYPKPLSLATAAVHHRKGLPAFRELKCSIPVGDLLEPAPDVPFETTVAEAKEMLTGREPLSALVVTENQRPKGLIMSHHLDRALSTRYGMSLYYHRSVLRIMDPAPLIAEAGTPVENVAASAMSREKYKIYDHIVVTEKGKYAGIVSVQKILDMLARVQVEMAKGANPLTGLPGNVAIELELEKRGAAGKPFSIIYADLDNFKVYNDTYGFKSGDNIILLIAKILSFAVRRHGNPQEDFVGHVGGDDFVCITRPETAERISNAVTRCFGRLVRHHYSPEDRVRGSITARDRKGETAAFPLVSVSLAIVDCLGQGCDLAAIGKRSAEMKKYAKTIPGNAFVRDRRAPLSIGVCEG